MKFKLLTPSLLLITLSFLLFFSCKKDPAHPHPPTGDSTTVNLKKGLLVYLPFMGNFADSSGNNNPTQLVGAGEGLTNDMNGNANSAFGGNGAGGRIEVTNNGSIKFDTAFSVSLNFMEHSISGRQVLASLVKVENGSGPSFLIGNSMIYTPTLWFGVPANSSCDEPGTNNATDTTDFVPQPESWYNLICTFRSGVLRVYLNGKLISQETNPNYLSRVCQNAKFVVGGWWQNDPLSINGKLDEVRLYDRALNEQEIAKLAEGFSTPPPPPVADLSRGLLVYLPFNGSIADSSGNNNPTQIVGYGAGLTYDIHGYANSAFGSDGSSGRLEVTNNGSIQFDTAFSVSLSFMERVVTPKQALATMVRVETGKGPSFFIGNSKDASNLWIGVPQSPCDEFGSTDLTDTTDFVPQPESWYNLICTFRKGVLRVYVNGNLFSQKTMPSYNPPVCQDAKFVVGGWWQNDPIPVNGKIDNVRLYNRELIPEEIALLSQYYQPTTNSVRQVRTN